MKKRPALFYLALFVFLIAVYLATSAGNTPYDYFFRLAQALLHGRYYLSDNPTWLSELITLSPGKYTFVNPPMPALLLSPLILIFGNLFQQTYLAHLLGAGSVTVLALLANRQLHAFKKALWLSLALGVGSVFFYLSATGSVWYLGQVTGTFFVLLAIYAATNQQHPLLLGITLSAAFLSRTQTLVSLPFFIGMLLYQNRNFGFKKIVQKILWLSLGLLIFPIVFFTYNYLRFGNILQTGYVFIPGILQEPWFAKGIFSLSYVSRHLKIIFTALPLFSHQFPYLTPSWGGLAIWITSPFFVYCLKANFKKVQNILAVLSILLIALVNFSFGSTGFSQFGYRYAVDFYPFLFVLLIDGLKNSRLKWHHWLLLGIAILVNIWGTVWINKFGWVSF